MLDWLGKVPTTNLRIVVTLALCIATGVRVIGLGWNPPLEWLGALSLWLGLDVAQFYSKRITHQPTKRRVGEGIRED